MGLREIQNIRDATVSMPVAKILIVLLVNLCFTCAMVPVTIVYFDGRTVSYEYSSPDVKDPNSDNKASSADTKGIWILYDDYNYYGASTLILNSDKTLYGKVYSLRPVGSSDGSFQSTITLYNGINFQGRDYFIPGNDAYFNGNASSAIVTGSEPWTLYAIHNFSGDSICLQPGQMYDISNIGIPENEIWSVRRGCFD